jgi:hypothetical protein
MTQSLAEIQAAYLAAQQGQPPAAPAAPQGFAPAPAAPLAPPPPQQAPQAPPGFYQASDGRFYPLAAQPSPQTPPAPAPAPQPAPAPLPAPAAPAAPQGFSVPPAQAIELAAQHAQQALPINPPEAQQALLPAAQSAMPEPKKRGGGRKRTAPAAGNANGNAAEGEDLSFAEAYAALAAFIPKGGSVTVAGEG